MPRLVSALLVLTALPAAAERPAPIEERAPREASMEERLTRLERAVAGQGLFDLANEVAALQRDVRLMRGELENQAYLIDQLRTEQREMYLDLERRFGGAPAAPGDAVPATVGEPAPPGDIPGSAAAPGGPAVSGSTAEAPAAGAGIPPDAEGAEAAAAPKPAGEVALRDPAPRPRAGDTRSGEPEAVQNAYQDAFDRLKNGEYPESIAAFRQFLADHPQSAYADNAQYWLGEAYYVTDEYDQAITEYRALIANFPASQKRSHALLKIGYSEDARGNPEAAREILEGLIRDYPNTTAARLASERLRRLPTASSADSSD